MPVIAPGDAQLVIDAVIAWSRDTLPEIEGAYDYDTGTKEQGLPDVAVECTTEGVDRSGLFPIPSQLQQIRAVYAYVCEASFMVGWNDPDDPDEQQAAAHKLREFAKALKSAIAADGTLGGRVQTVSRFHTFEYRPGHVEFADGTRGREMRMQLVVGELQGA